MPRARAAHRPPPAPAPRGGGAVGGAGAAPEVEVGPRQGAQLPVVTLVTDGALSGAVGSDVLAVGVDRARVDGAASGAALGGAVHAAVGSAYGTDLARAAQRASFTGGAGATLALAGVEPVAGSATPAGALPARLLLLGTGDRSPRDLRRAGAALARAARGTRRAATTALADATADQVAAFVEGFALASWTTPRTGLAPTAARTAAATPAGTDPSEQAPSEQAPSGQALPGGPVPSQGAELLLLGATPAAAAAAARAGTSARATWRARDLVATPASTKTPAWVAGQARALATGLPGVSVDVVSGAALAAGGFGGLVAVGAASPSPPCLVTVSWTPPAAARRGRRVVLVGKGITFDTGGLAVKPRESMVAMKNDMAGAAVVLAAVLGAAELGLPCAVTALLPLAENSLGGASYRPGDVVTVHGGTTVEIANPDAEGRLVLADALHLADAELAPDVLVDVATLTGAAPLALGKRHAALFTDDDALADELALAADETGERLWRLPLVDDYRSSLDSEVADLRHVPATSPGAGAVTAALFLREFTGSRRWAHLDIAGPTTAGADEHEVVKGATGYGARLLLRWLEATS